MDPLSQVFCLKWNNHQNNLLTVLDHLYQTEAFCDVTLACDNTSIKCHKMILSACSSYFQTLFMENTCEHPIVFLKDIKISEVRAILDYMYKGEVNVAQEELPGKFFLYFLQFFFFFFCKERNCWMIWNSPSVSPLRFQITIVLTRSLALQKKIHLIYHTSAILIKPAFFSFMISRIFFSQ